MPTRRAAGVVLLMAFAALIGCKRMMPAPGPVQLRDAAHMASFLTDANWRLVDHSPDIHWVFTEQTFTLSMAEDGTRMLHDVVPELPEDVLAVEGAWSVTETTLTLTAMTDQSGARVPDITIALDWVDGKLSINIGAYQYRRFRSGG